MLQRHGLERRLFGWLVALALVPTLIVLAVSLAANQQLFGWMGTLGPWERIGESGRAVLEAADTLDVPPVLSERLEQHRAELSQSLLQVQRWNVLRSRMATLTIFLVLALAIVGALGALWVSRRIARTLARPVAELVEWTDRLARNEPLPAPARSERRDVAEVGVLRGALRDAATRIAQARRAEVEAERVHAWGELARRVAHEMKNPLTPLRLATHRLARTADGDTAVADALGIIDQETARLEELAREFATLGRPSGQRSQVDLGELLERLLESDVPATIDSSITITPGTPEVLGDYDTLLRAFRNMIRNAVEASPAGRIEVTVSTAVRNPQAHHANDIPTGIAAEVLIADNGTGLPEGAEDRIFEPDYSGKTGGTGLGLAVVRQVVAAHGGTVGARNRGTGGAEFRVVLPAGQAHDGSRAGTGVEPTSGVGKQIPGTEAERDKG